MTTKTDIAWHFVGERLRDGRPVPADGQVLLHTGRLIMCESGLHFSRHPFDALQYAPGPVLCKVRIGGTIIDDTDKGICSKRTILARMDATEMLRYFARMQALSVVHLWDAPQILIDYLMTGDESLRAAARAAARDAARDDLAWDPAWAAALDAAWAAAWSAARAAAWSAARDAARAAARAAALDAAWAAARDPAWDQAWDAALDAARSDLATLVNECFDGTES